MRYALPLLLLLGCKPAAPAVDPAEVKLRDTSISGIKDMLAKAKSSDKSDRDLARITAPAICDKPGLDKVMKSKQLEQEILDECAKDIPQIEALTKQ